MRLKVSITTEKVPIVFRHRVLAFIKRVLQTYDEEYQNNLYNTKTPKTFTFNLVFDRSNQKEEEFSIDEDVKIKDKVFYQDKPISLYISSNDYEFLINFINGVRRVQTFEFNKSDNIIWEIRKPDILKEKTIFNNEVTFQTNAPFVIETKDDKPVIFSDEYFQEELNGVMDKIFKTLNGRGLKETLEFVPITMKTVIAKHTLKKFREQTKKPIMYITGNVGVFKLKGHPEDLQTIYQIGLGNRTGQGFGMLEVV